MRAEVLDADSGTVVGSIADTPGVHGIAIAGQHGFTTNGRENKLTVFTPSSLAVIKKLDVGKGPDGIFNHAGTKRIFTCNHGSDDIAVVHRRGHGEGGRVRSETAQDCEADANWSGQSADRPGL